MRIYYFILVWKGLKLKKKNPFKKCFFYHFYWFVTNEKWCQIWICPMKKCLIMFHFRFDFESHWNTFVFFDKKDMVSAFTMSHRETSDFVSFPLFGITLIMKLTNFDFEGHKNTLIFFDKKRCQIWLSLVKECLIWLRFCYLRKFLTISWEIRILGFIKIV